MNAKRVFSAIVAAMAMGGSAFAIEATQLPLPPAQPAPADLASMPMECAKAPMKRHDHGAERGLGVAAVTPMTMMMTMPCPMERGALPADTKADKRLPHDHGRFHKNQW